MAENTGIDTSLVTVGQPVEGGCCWTSFADAPTLPTDATTAMGTLADFESLGELSENGYTESTSATSNKFKGWHGSVVLTTISDTENTYKLEFIEPYRPTVAKLRFGKDNVTVDEAGVVTAIKGKALSNVTVPLVIDELESNGYLRRIVVPKASIDSFDDVAHQKGSLLVYGMTFTAIEVDGVMFNTYRAKPAEA